MAINESIVSRKYRILVDAASKAWARVSFWTQAKDVYNDAGDNLENTVGWVKGKASDSTKDTAGYLYDSKTVREEITVLKDSVANYGSGAIETGSELETGTFYWQYK